MPLESYFLVNIIVFMADTKTEILNLDAFIDVYEVSRKKIIAVQGLSYDALTEHMRSKLLRQVLRLEIG